MEIDIPDSFEWREPWTAITDPRAKSVYRFVIAEHATGDVSQALIDELRDEMCPEHPLYSASLRVAAFCTSDTDDILYLTDQVAMPIVCVHLTWEKETSSQWPHFDSYGSLDEWRQQMEIESKAHENGC